MTDEKKITVLFYKAKSGSEPVRDWLKSLSKEDKLKIGTDIKTVEYGFPVGMPTCKSMGKGLYEVRTNLDNRIARVFFCIDDSKMVLLHGFIKKSQETPKQDLDIALKRKKQLEEKT
jgi:phage-related protein